MLEYKVFNTKDEVAMANGTLLYSLHKDGKKLKEKLKGTTMFSIGKELKDGRFACKIPKEYSDKFGGKKEKLDKDKFKKVKL